MYPAVSLTGHRLKNLTESRNTSVANSAPRDLSCANGVCLTQTIIQTQIVSVSGQPVSTSVSTLVSVSSRASSVTSRSSPVTSVRDSSRVVGTSSNTPAVTVPTAIAPVAPAQPTGTGPSGTAIADLLETYQCMCLYKLASGPNLTRKSRLASPLWGANHCLVRRAKSTSTSACGGLVRCLNLH